MGDSQGKAYRVEGTKKFQIEGTTHVAIMYSELNTGYKKSELLVINAADHPEMLFFDAAILTETSLQRYMNWSIQ